MPRSIVAALVRSITLPSAPGRAKRLDELFRKVQAIGAEVVSEPREYPEYTPAGYYAFFFKDPDGIKFEIVHHSQV